MVTRWRVYFACGCQSIGRYRPVLSSSAACHEHGDTFVTAVMRWDGNGSYDEYGDSNVG